MPAPSDLCPLCQQRALALNEAGTLLACTHCGAKADFDGATRRVRYTFVPAGYAQLDGVLRGLWLSRSEVFERTTAAARPSTKRNRLTPIALAFALLGGLGVLGLMGLVVVMVRGIPEQPASTSRSIGPTATVAVAMTPTPAQTPTSAAPSFSSATMVASTSMLTLIPTPLPSIAAALPNEIATATPGVQLPSPSNVATDLAPSPTAPNLPTPLPTVDGRRVDGRRIELIELTELIESTTTPASPSAAPTTLIPTPTQRDVATTAPIATPAPAAAPLPVGSDSTIAVATTQATSTPTSTPTETLLPTPTPTLTPMPTSTPAPLVISKIAYVGGSTFEEYLELTNATDQVLEIAILTWRMRISAAVGEVELKLGDYLSAPFSLPARQSCRLYTSKRTPSADEISPCGFLTLGLADDIDGLYPDKPGVTVTLLNAEGLRVAAFRY